MLLAASLILAGLSGLELALTPSPSPRPPAYLTDELTQAGERGKGGGRTSTPISRLER